MLKSLKSLKTLSILVATAVTTGLFVLMGFLIFQDPNFKMEKTQNVQVNFLRNYKETQVENMERKKPEKPEEVQQVDAPPVSVMQAQQPVSQLQQNLQSFETFDSTSFAGGVGVSGFGGVTSAGSGDGNRGLTPLIRVQCDPPRQAKMEGIKGFITLQYDVNTNGMVEDVMVVQGKPPRVFDQNCIRALSQWRFKPKMVDGKAMAVKGNRFTFTFDYSGEAN